MVKRAEYEEDRSLVSESEQFVFAVRDKLKNDIDRVRSEVVGRTGRGFLQVQLTPEERVEQYRQARVLDMPEEWAKQLERAGQDPQARGRLVRAWKNYEAEWRKEQAGGNGLA